MVYHASYRVIYVDADYIQDVQVVVVVVVVVVVPFWEIKKWNLSG